MRLFTGKEASASYQFDLEGLKKIGVVLMWSGASAILTSLIGLLPNIDVPQAWIVVVPIINSILISLKEFVNDKR